MYDILVDPGVIEAQYEDKRREFENLRQVRAASQPRPNRPQKVVAALRKTMDGLTRPLPSFKPTNRAQA